MLTIFMPTYTDAELEAMLDAGRSRMRRYHNPNPAGAMAVLKYTSKFGLGLDLVRLTMEQNGNPPPEFIVDRTHVRVVLRKRLNPWND